MRRAMDPARWQRLEEVFHLALAASGGERERVLAGACGDDHELRREVVSLLASATPEAAAAIDDVVAVEASDLAGQVQRMAVGRRLGPYRLGRLLGAGGMGAVYQAERDDAEFTRTVAIKILLYATGSPEAVAR